MTKLPIPVMHNDVATKRTLGINIVNSEIASFRRVNHTLSA